MNRRRSAAATRNAVLLFCGLTCLAGSPANEPLIFGALSANLSHHKLRSLMMAHRLPGAWQCACAPPFFWWGLTRLHQLAARYVLVVLFGDLNDGDSVDKGVSSHIVQPFN